VEMLHWLLIPHFHQNLYNIMASPYIRKEGHKVSGTWAKIEKAHLDYSKPKPLKHQLEITTAEGDEDHLPRQWLCAVADQSYAWHAWVTAWTADWAFLQAVCAKRVVLSALSASGQTWLVQHGQTASRRNI